MCLGTSLDVPTDLSVTVINTGSAFFDLPKNLKNSVFCEDFKTPFTSRIIIAFFKDPFVEEVY